MSWTMLWLAWQRDGSMFACIMTGIAGSVSAYIEAGIVDGKEDELERRG